MTKRVRTGASVQDKLISEFMETVVETITESITSESHASSKSPPRSTGGTSSSADIENRPNLKMFERADWTLLRTVEGLQQKAGVATTWLRRLVIKEIGDNALDAGATIRAGYIEDGGRVFVEDDGPGLDGTPEEIADLFSIARPMRSTKLLRLPQRGALGSGLRIVAGTVLASNGTLAVITHNRRIVLRPQADGSTAVVKVTKAKQPVGTRIEVGFGPALPEDCNQFTWLYDAIAVAAFGKHYDGRSSPFWYDAAAFHELLLACGAQPVRSLVAQLDGCSGAKAGEIVAAAGLERVACKDVSRQQAEKLLLAARSEARPVSPERLGHVGRDAFPSHWYTVERGTAAIGSSKPQADIPFVVEAWAKKLVDNVEKSDASDIEIDLLINRTPSTAEVAAWRDSDKDLRLEGGGFDGDFCPDAPKKGSYHVQVNVTTPYCPILSEGKAPNLEAFADEIFTAIKMAMRKAQRAVPKDRKRSQKDVVLGNLDRVIADVSGDGEFRFNARQLLYGLRPIVMHELGEELKIGNFTQIITDYESEHGEIDGMYREPRGSITHPHRDETVTLGTLMVEEYERPVWTFNKLLFIEKEGANEALKAVRWPERHDCAVMSSKGFSSRAARDLIDKLAEHDEPITVYAVTDADAYGSMIHQTLQEATKARGARKINIVHLGLQPWEAIAMGLEVETVKQGDKRKPVADYVKAADESGEHGTAPDGDSWEDWLQTHRVELNAMTTPQFIEWLDAKMAAHKVGKLVPPAAVLTAELDQRTKDKVRAILTERIQREAGLEQQVKAAIAKIKKPSAAALAKGIKQSFKEKADREWRDHIEAEAKKRTLKI